MRTPFSFIRWVLAAAALACAAAGPAPLRAAGQAVSAERARWKPILDSRYAVPEGRAAIDVLLEMNALLASTDPVLRDDVAFGSAERWIRDGRLTPADLRRLMPLWMANTNDGLGTSDDRVFKRSFSALCLSLLAARDLTDLFLEPPELQALFDGMLTYFDKEIDVRGFDVQRGWMHSVAHTSDTLKFLARNPRLAAGVDRRLLDAVRRKIDTVPAVFAWGENDRMALALQSAVRRSDADAAVLARWLEGWVGEHEKLWAGGSHVDARQFAKVENAKQVLRSLHTALAMEAKPTPAGDSARQAVLAALAKMR